MRDPLGFVLLSGVGVVGLTFAGIGIRRGKAVTIFGHSRDDKPGRFWYSVIFQGVLGIACLILAGIKIFG